MPPMLQFGGDGGDSRDLIPALARDGEEVKTALDADCAAFSARTACTPREARP